MSENDLGNLETLKKLKTLLEKDLACINNILDEKAISIGKDWSWAELPFINLELFIFLKNTKNIS
jgi:hypothetical protein